MFGFKRFADYHADAQPELSELAIKIQYDNNTKPNLELDM